MEKCIYCLKDIGKNSATKDHFPAKNWSDEKQRITVPSCSDCNHSYGDIENRLMRYVGLCLTKDSPYKNITEKVLRAYDPESGHNKKDCRVRSVEKQKLNKNTVIITPEMRQAVLPTATGGSMDLPSNIGVLINELDIMLLAHKFIRASVYTEFKEYIGPDYRIVSFIAKEEVPIFMEYRYRDYVKNFNYGPLNVQVFKAGDLTSVWSFKLWDHFKFNSVCLNLNNILENKCKYRDEHVDTFIHELERYATGPLYKLPLMVLGDALSINSQGAS